MRVLHVSEALGGGITSAMVAMVEATPEIDHHLLARPRAAHDTGADLEDTFASVCLLPRNPVQAALAVRRSSRELFPDIIHAHSSVAGAVVRMAGLRHARIVYSPHCFAFERRDLTRTQRLAFSAVERLLAPRTDLLVAVAPSELDVARALGYEKVDYAPNRTPGALPGTARYARPLQVAAAGRICRQKDWRYFLHVKRYAESQLGIAATWTWLGGGDPEGERALADAGVDVSGWIPRTELLRRMAGAQVYLHTAAWEAAPISVLEAAALGLPLALRSIPPLDSLSLPGRFGSVPALAARIGALRSPAVWQRAHAESLALADACSRQDQGDRLTEAYERAYRGDRLAPASTASTASTAPLVPLDSAVTPRATLDQAARSAPSGALR